MKIKFFLASAIFALSAQVYAAPFNYVQNGSFETPVVGSNTWDTFYGNVGGWQTGDNGLEIRNNVAGAAYDGVQFAELDTTANSSIYQTFDNLAAGKTYQLSFAYSPRENVAEASNGIDVMWNGSSVTSLTQSGIGNNGNVWMVYTFDVTATGKDILGFDASGTSDSYGGSLDAVSLSAVPVPAAAFMFAPALLGFLGFRRKMKNTTA